MNDVWYGMNVREIRVGPQAVRYNAPEGSVRFAHSILPTIYCVLLRRTCILRAPSTHVARIAKPFLRIRTALPAASFRKSPITPARRGRWCSIFDISNNLFSEIYKNIWWWGVNIYIFAEVIVSVLNCVQPLTLK